MISRNDIINPSNNEGTPGLTRGFGWAGWLPLLLLPSLAISFCNRCAPWVFMWAICFALFFACKWLTWWQAWDATQISGRDLAYLFAWPGLDAHAFLKTSTSPARPTAVKWFEAAFKTLVGIGLLWGLTPVVPVDERTA